MDKKSLLPNNANRLLRDIEDTGCGISFFEIINHHLRNPDKCPNHILPWLGWCLSADLWDEEWPEDIRRKIIKATIGVHQHKGTLGAIRRALKVFDFENTRIEEWFAYGGEPYHFQIFLDFKHKAPVLKDMATALLVIDDAKNLRSHLEKFEITISTVSEVPKLGMVAIGGEIIYLYQDLTLPDMPFTPSAAMALASGEIVEITPDPQGEGPLVPYVGIVSVSTERVEVYPKE